MLSLYGFATGVRDLLTEASEAAVGFTIPEIAGHTPTICEEFARTIAMDPNRRDLLKPADPFTGTIAGGFYDLAPNMAAPDRWLLDFFHVTEFRKNPDDLGTVFHLVSETSKLRLKRPTDSMFITAAIDGSVLYTRDTTGSLIADLGPITISGPFIPHIDEDALLTTLPFALEGSLQAFGAQYLLGMRPQSRQRRAGI